jgi:hypothetical protein
MSDGVLLVVVETCPRPRDEVACCYYCRSASSLHGSSSGLCCRVYLSTKWRLIVWCECTAVVRREWWMLCMMQWRDSDSLTHSLKPAIPNIIYMPSHTYSFLSLTQSNDSHSLTHSPAVAVAVAGACWESRAASALCCWASLSFSDKSSISSWCCAVCRDE